MPAQEVPIDFFDSAFRITQLRKELELIKTEMASQAAQSVGLRFPLLQRSPMTYSDTKSRYHEVWYMAFLNLHLWRAHSIFLLAYQIE